MADILGEGLFVTVFAMTIVFVELVAIQYLIKLQTIILNPSIKINKRKEEIKANKEVIKEDLNEDNSEEIVAVIMGALSEELGVPITSLNIRTIKRVGTNNLPWRNANINSK